MIMSSSSGLEQGQSPSDDSAIPSVSAAGPPPICRQFWKAGSYNANASSKVNIQNNKNHLHVHPMFLHSNATSHKWAFGAIAELLDNAIDEIQNGATFVIVDKILSPRDGSSALLIQDDGGGMDPEAMRRCMSFGYSDKKSNSSIGHYGNGFKTSSMRLGADVIVFSRHQDNRSVTQSIGLLSYTFLTMTGLDRIVVPMVDYKVIPSTGRFEMLHGRDHFTSNLSILLRWSPFSTETELLEQFNDIGSHGTKVIIYNLWLNNDGNLELDFDSDPKDIRIGGDTKEIASRWKSENEKHIANRYHHSLRVYLSILYLRIPETFKMFLRGEVVEHHNVVDDLIYPEYILYRPQCGGNVEGSIVTTIGFLKEAPHVNIHGFCVYNKNRLILPYWQVVNYSDSRGRGVVGALQANFIEPAHNKQGFERTSLFQKLEVRLKEMTWEYWDYHCGLIGHQQKKKPQPYVPPALSSVRRKGGVQQPSVRNKIFTAFGRAKYGSSFGRAEPLIANSYGRISQGYAKRKEHDDLAEANTVKRQAGNSGNVIPQPVNSTSNFSKDQEVFNLMQENKRLHTRCLEYEKNREDLNLKVLRLGNEIEEVNREYVQLLAELRSADVVSGERVAVKNEKRVNT